MRCFRLHFGQDVVWYRVVLDEPLSIERLPGPCACGIDPFTIETLTSRMVRKLSANSRRSLMAMETAFRHEAEAY